MKIEEIIQKLGDPTTFSEGIAGMTEKIEELETTVGKLTSANAQLTSANTALYLRATGQEQTAEPEEPEDKYEALIQKMRGK